MYEELIWKEKKKKSSLARARMKENGRRRKRKVFIAALISSQTLRRKYGKRTRKRFAKDLEPVSPTISFDFSKVSYILIILAK